MITNQGRSSPQDMDLEMEKSLLFRSKRGNTHLLGKLAKRFKDQEKGQEVRRQAEDISNIQDRREGVQPRPFPGEIPTLEKASITASTEGIWAP